MFKLCGVNHEKGICTVETYLTLAIGILGSDVNETQNPINNLSFFLNELLMKANYTVLSFKLLCKCLVQIIAN